MSTPYVSEIEAFAFNFAPRGWLMCQGQLLPIQQYQALFALLGTTFGGNGTTNFQLPDLRGRVAIGYGQGPGLSNYALGGVAGTENVTVLTPNMPQHTHLVAANNSTTGGTNVPGTTVVLSAGSDVPTSGTATAVSIYGNAASLAAMAPAAVSTVGGNLPHSNVGPVLAINYCIAINGVFPSRT